MLNLFFFCLAATLNWKSQALPLARIKKIMRSEEPIYADLDKDVSSQSSPSAVGRFMIAGEAPVLLGKACELMIQELSLRAWMHTERNRRKTLQKADIHNAVGDSDVFDFLIDFIPQRPVSSAPAPIPAYQFQPHHHMVATSSMNGVGRDLADRERNLAHLQSQYQPPHHDQQPQAAYPPTTHTTASRQPS